MLRCTAICSSTAYTPPKFKYSPSGYAKLQGCSTSIHCHQKSNHQNISMAVTNQKQHTMRSLVLLVTLFWNITIMRF